MTTTDVGQLLKQAIVTIVDADTGVQAITGRTSGSCIPFRSTDEPQPVPVVLYHVVDMPEIGGAGDNRLAEVQLTCLGEGPTGDVQASNLAERMEQCFTVAAFDSAGLNAMVLRRARRDVPNDDDVTRAVYRVDLDLTIQVTK